MEMGGEIFKNLRLEAPQLFCVEDQSIFNRSAI